ncbi:MAG: hypothetical protein AAFY41_13550, partial [Bacteroidota bacterium]
KEVFPDTPRIEFEDVFFVDADNAQDSLVLTFSFEDGNGDIGLSNQDDAFPPYHFSNVILDADSLIVTDTSAYNPPYIKAAISLLPVVVRLRDGLNEQTGEPRFREVVVSEFRRVDNFVSIGDEDPRIGASQCDDFLDFTFHFPVEVAPNVDDLSSTTVRGLIERNDTYYNLVIEFYEQRPDGTEQLIDFNSIFNACTEPFSGRIPIFDPTGNQGSITYTMKSNGFNGGLGGKPVKLRFYVLDRGLNQSNIVDTEFFFLEDITQ